MRTLTHDQAYALAHALEDRADAYLERDSGDEVKLEVGLFPRCSKAAQWLEMMIRHTTRESLIIPSNEVIGAAFDANVARELWAR